MSRDLFPKDFLWGAATASAQIEGGWNEDGRTPSIWDVTLPEQVTHGENNHTASDHYHHWREDVEIMKRLGLNSYRFSISWSRVMPEEGRVNEKGLKFYSDLVDALLENGIEPLVTIYHWDLPLWVYEKGGWLSEEIIPLFEAYTKVVVEALSDRVTWWMTMNEPGSFIRDGYVRGFQAPFHHDHDKISVLTRNCMLAHAVGVETIRRCAKREVRVGFALGCGAYIPEAKTPEEIEKARKASLEAGEGLIVNSWWLEPMLAGRPVVFDGYMLQQEDMRQICQPLDFIGLNMYTPLPDLDGKATAPGTPRNALGWVIDARVVYWTIRFVYEKYGLPIMVSENGVSLHDWVSLDGKVHDPGRADFIKRYVGQIGRALAEGIPVIGYQYWSLLDNFEWSFGYDPRFGLTYVDYSTGERIIKDSAWEYKRIIETNGKELL